MSAGEPAERGGIRWAFIWMVGTLLSLLSVGLAGRELSAEVEPHHAAFYRNAICLLILLPIVARSGFQSVRTPHLGRHVLRNTVHFFAQWCWLFGLGVLPLAEVFAIEFTSPIWTALLASLFLSERLTRWRISAIALGFAGILVLLRPGLSIIDPASFVVLASALGYAIAYVITKNLVGEDSPITVVWWMNIVQLPIGFALAGGHIILPSFGLMPWVVVIGVAGLTSHYCLSQALRCADATVVIPFDFLRLPLAAGIAWVAYGEVPDYFLVLGAALILAGNWINVRRGM